MSHLGGGTSNKIGVAQESRKRHDVAPQHRCTASRDEKMADASTAALTKNAKVSTLSRRDSTRENDSRHDDSRDFDGRHSSSARNEKHLNPSAVHAFKHNGSRNSSKPQQDGRTAGAYFAATHEKSGLSLEYYASRRAPNVVATHGTPHVFLPLRPFRPD